jgi:hypothetical protein
MGPHDMSPMEVLLTYTPGIIVYSSILETRATVVRVDVWDESVRLSVRDEYGRDQNWSAFANIHEVYDVRQA